MRRIEKIICYYLDAKESVLSNGFSVEIAWQEQQSVNSISQKTFLSEYAWVVLSSGMKEAVVRKKYQQLSTLFSLWENPALINNNKNRLNRLALKIFNHKGKVKAIFEMASYLMQNDFKQEIRNIENHGISYLEKFYYLGPATSFHFAKNLGFNVTKPDRHLVRIAKHFGYSKPETLCQSISAYTGEKQSVIDLILWRYATINKNYLKN